MHLCKYGYHLTDLRKTALASNFIFYLNNYFYVQTNADYSHTHSSWLETSTYSEYLSNTTSSDYDLTNPLIFTVVK